MRTLIELLELLKQEISTPTNNYHKGICNVIRYMVCSDKLTLKEQNKLFYHIGKNKPESYTTYCPYYFKAGDMEVRIEYLDNLITSLKADKLITL